MMINYFPFLSDTFELVALLELVFEHDFFNEKNKHTLKRR